MAERVVVTGIGVVSPLGIGLEKFGARLQAGQSAIGPLEHLDASMLQTRIVGRIPDAELDEALGNPEEYAGMDRATKLAVLASDMAFKDAKLGNNAAPPQKRGLAYGSAFGSAESFEGIYRQYLEKKNPRIKPSSIEHLLPDYAAQFLAARHSLRKWSLNSAGGATASLQAIVSAVREIQHGSIDLALAGGMEYPLTEGLLHALDAYRIMTRSHNDEPARGSRPFAADRSGCVPAEGAAFLVLEREEAAMQRGVEIYGSIGGVGYGMGATDLMNPNPDALASAMAEALAEASMQRRDLHCIVAQAASMPNADRAEWEAIEKVFGELAGNIPTTAVKSMIGESFGASGALATVCALAALVGSFIPPTINQENPDPDCHIDCVPNETRRQEVQAALVNALSMSGAAVSLLVSR